MDEQNYTSPEPEMKEVENELSHSDKLVGVFSEPGATFSSMVKFPVKAMDWLLPLLLIAIISAVGLGIVFSKPAIKQNFIDKTSETVEKQMQESVENGEMTQERADQALEMAQSFMVVGAVAGRSVGSIFMFFLMTLIIFLLAKFVLKGEGTFGSALAACGLPQYIMLIQLLLTVILSIVLGRFLESTSIGALIDADKTSVAGYLLYMLDIIFFWYLIVISIGLAKMFKSATTGKYYVMNFSVFIVISAIMFFLQ